MPGKVYRNFDDAMPALRTDEIVFELGGEEFHCVPEAPGGVLADLFGSVTYDERGRAILHLGNMRTFVESILLEERQVASPRPPREPEVDADGNPVESTEPIEEVLVTEATDDMARWDVLMHDKSRPIPIEVLRDVVFWLQAQYTENRPTEPPRR